MTFRAATRLEGTLANRPPTGVSRRFYLATDEGKLYYDDGAAWKEVGVEPGYVDAVLADNPYAFWLLDEASGTTATDEMGAATGSYVNAPTLGQTGLVQGTAVQFDGVDDHVRADAAITPFTSAAWSIEFWATTTSTSVLYLGGPATDLNNSRWVSILLNAQDNLTADGLYIAGQVYDDAGTFANTVARYNTGGSHRDGAKHHYVLTYDGSGHLYYDGVNVANTAVTPQPASLRWFAIGVLPKASYTGWFSGVQDAPAVYDHTLTPARVQAHYDAGMAA